MPVMRSTIIVILLALGAFGQDEGAGSAGVEAWEDRLMATRSAEERAAVFSAAATSNEPAAEVFLTRRLKGPRLDEQGRAALRACLAAPTFDLLPHLQRLDTELTTTEARLELWRGVAAARAWRSRGLRVLAQIIETHRHDPHGAEIFPVLEDFLPTLTERMARKLADLLLSLYEDPACEGLSARAWEMGTRLPEEQAFDFLAYALISVDPDFALPAARKLTAMRTEGARELIGDAILQEPGRALRAGLDRLITDPSSAWLRIALLRGIETIDDPGFEFLRDTLGRLDEPEIDDYVNHALPAGNDRITMLACDRIRAGKLRVANEVLDALLESTESEAMRILLLDTLAGSSRSSERRRSLESRLRTTKPDLRLERLFALAEAAPRSPELRRWLDHALERPGSDWARYSALLYAAGRLKLDSFPTHADRALDHKRWQVRLAAIEGLVAHASRSALARLATMSGAERLRLARAASDGLRALTGKNFGTSPSAWMREIASLPRDWRPLRHPDEAQPDEAADLRYAPSFYGLDLGSNHVIFVCDVSGSMEGAKIEHLKEEMNAAISDIDSKGAFNTIFFSAGPRRLWGSIQEANKRNKSRAREFVDRASADGGTNLWSGLELAFRDENADTIVVLTDGQPTLGRYQLPADILRESRTLNRSLRMRIHAIQLGGFAGARLLEDLAALGQGELVVIP